MDDNAPFLPPTRLLRFPATRHPPAEADAFDEAAVNDARDECHRVAFSKAGSYLYMSNPF